MSLDNTLLEKTVCKHFDGKEGIKYPVYCKYFHIKERINPKCVLCTDDSINQIKKTENS